MTEETEAGQPEGDVLPDAAPTPLSLEQRLRAALDSWYANHFHAAAIAGRAPISADDKDALTKSVLGVVAPTKE